MERIDSPRKHRVHPIRRARERRGMTQSALAEVMGTQPAIISKWEAGTVFPRPVIAFRLSRELGIPLEAVYDGARAA